MPKAKTFSAKPSELSAGWYLVDARGQTLGRLAANVARLLRGKHKPVFTPHLNSGDHVIVINVKSIKVTGKKMEDKVYTSFTGYPGGLRKRAYGDMLNLHPTFPFRHAVSGMLQHGTLGKDQLSRLKVYSGDRHPHTAQKPVPIRFGTRGEIEVLGR
jgi:large subunit ribosomal protein L13